MNTSNQQKITNTEAQEFIKSNYPFLEFNTHILNGLDKSTFLCLAGSHEAKVNHLSGMIKIVVTEFHSSLTKGRLVDAVHSLIDGLSGIEDSISLHEKSLEFFNTQLNSSNSGGSEQKSLSAKKANIIKALSILRDAKAQFTEYKLNLS
jgi:hypothetical protein